MWKFFSDFSTRWDKLFLREVLCFLDLCCVVDFFVVWLLLLKYLIVVVGLEEFEFTTISLFVEVFVRIDFFLRVVWFFVFLFLFLVCFLLWFVLLIVVFDFVLVFDVVLFVLLFVACVLGKWFVRRFSTTMGIILLFCGIKLSVLGYNFINVEMIKLECVMSMIIFLLYLLKMLVRMIFTWFIIAMMFFFFSLFNFKLVLCVSVRLL